MRSMRLPSAGTLEGGSSSRFPGTVRKPFLRSTTTERASRRKSPITCLKCSRPRSRREWGSGFRLRRKLLGGMQGEWDGGPCGPKARASSSSYLSMDLKQIPARRRVHIVDDEPEVREALALLLSTAGIESTAHGSAEAYLETVP